MLWECCFGRLNGLEAVIVEVGLENSYTDPTLSTKSNCNEIMASQTPFPRSLTYPAIMCICNKSSMFLHGVVELFFLW